MKKTTIADKMAELQAQMDLLEALESAMHRIRLDQMDYGEFRMDEDGSLVQDEHGDYIVDPPSPDADHRYKRWTAYETILNHLEKLAK